MTIPDITGTLGTEMFARYAYAPNKLGYCGPHDSRLLAGSRREIENAARQFTGAWPYLEVMSRMSGIPDPLDHRLVDSYWLGGGVGTDFDPRTFTTELLEIIGPQAGHYWGHLDADLVDEAAPNHCFHVFGIYPWSRLLGRGHDEHPLSILENCRISWGTVLSTSEASAEVLCSRLRWSSSEKSLSLMPPEAHGVGTGRGPGKDIAVEPGDLVAMHWGQVCDRLTSAQVARLGECTVHQLHATSQRLKSSSA